MRSWRVGAVHDRRSAFDQLLVGEDVPRREALTMAATKRTLKVAFEVEDLTLKEAQEPADLLWWTTKTWCTRQDHEIGLALATGHELKGWDDVEVDIRFDGIRKLKSGD
jgi:hypothetical protein